jgi:hypothetical protein
MITTTRASEVGEIAATAIMEISSKAVEGLTVAAYAESDLRPVPWSTIANGGWDLLGVSEADGGAGATLRDLAEVAKTCGKFILPLPLIETLWVKRWSRASRESDEPVTVSVPRIGSALGGIAPYAADGDVLVARSVASSRDVMELPAEVTRDDFAPTLRTGLLPWVTEMQAGVGHELVVMWAAECVGGAQRLLQLSVEYAKARHQFGRPIGSFQAVKHRLANMHTQAESAETAVIWASVDEANAARVAQFAMDTAITVAQSAIQVHGGMGFTWELGLHFYLRSMLMRRDLSRSLLA